DTGKEGGGGERRDRSQPASVRERERVEAPGEKHGSSDEQPAGPLRKRPWPPCDRPRGGDEAQRMEHLVPGRGLEYGEQVGGKAEPECVGAECARGDRQGRRRGTETEEEEVHAIHWPGARPPLPASQHGPPRRRGTP